MEGGELARGTPGGETAGTSPPESTPPQPAPRDVTLRWEDVWTRYEMLFGQRYGSTDATWEEYQPIYRSAWEMANDPRYRGKPWSDVKEEVKQAYGRQGGPAWDRVEGAFGDVWEDVADEAQTGHEGGAERREPRPDQGTRGGTAD